MADRISTTFPLDDSLKTSQFIDNQLLNHIAASVPIEKLVWPALDDLKLNLYCHRNDVISQTYSGNKFYKLYYNIKQALLEGKPYLLSFGGAYSNHLYALAALGAQLGINTIGVIRGVEPKVLSPTLYDAKKWGMTLCFVDKHTYRHKDITALSGDVADLIDNGKVYIIPEGGSNVYGFKGCVEMGKAIATHLPDTPYTLCSATATGATLAGLVAGSPSRCQNLAVSVLKGVDDTMAQQINGYLSRLTQDIINGSFYVERRFHCGGYAKANKALIDFIQVFESNNNIQLDPVYTGKLFLAVEKLALEGRWQQGDHIILVHTGGLQGRRGFRHLLDQ